MLFHRAPRSGDSHFGSTPGTAGGRGAPRGPGPRGLEPFLGPFSGHSRDRRPGTEGTPRAGAEHPAQGSFKAPQAGPPPLRHSARPLLAGLCLCWCLRPKPWGAGSRTRSAPLCSGFLPNCSARAPSSRQPQPRAAPGPSTRGRCGWRGSGVPRGHPKATWDKPRPWRGAGPAQQQCGGQEGRVPHPSPSWCRQPLPKMLLHVENELQCPWWSEEPGSASTAPAGGCGLSLETLGSRRLRPGAGHQWEYVDVGSQGLRWKP